MQSMSLSLGTVPNLDWLLIRLWSCGTEFTLRNEVSRLGPSTYGWRPCDDWRSADSGLLSPELAAGIHRVKGVRKLGSRLGNWLSAGEASALWQLPDRQTLTGKRNRAILAILLGCGLRRRELAELTMESIQRREGRWAIVDLVGKGKHIRTVPVPAWVKDTLDLWLAAAGIESGPLFRCVCRADKLWGHGISEKTVWHVVKKAAASIRIPQLSPHDLRRSCARLCHASGGELETGLPSQPFDRRQRMRDRIMLIASMHIANRQNFLLARALHRARGAWGRCLPPQSCSAGPRPSWPCPEETSVLACVCQ
jgi:integrase